MRWKAAQSRERTTTAATATTSPATRVCPDLTVDQYVSNVTAKRPLNDSDVGMIAALTVDQWGPYWLTKTREERKIRARLIRYMRNPDPSGMDQPEDEEWNLFPELYERFQEQQKNRR